MMMMRVHCRYSMVTLFHFNSKHFPVASHQQRISFSTMTLRRRQKSFSWWYVSLAVLIIVLTYSCSCGWNAAVVLCLILRFELSQTGYQRSWSCLVVEKIWHGLGLSPISDQKSEVSVSDHRVSFTCLVRSMILVLGYWESNGRVLSDFQRVYRKVVLKVLTEQCAEVELVWVIDQTSSISCCCFCNFRTPLSLVGTELSASWWRQSARNLSDVFYAAVHQLRVKPVCDMFVASIITLLSVIWQFLFHVFIHFTVCMCFVLDLFERLLIWHQFAILTSPVQKPESLHVIVGHFPAEFGTLFHKSALQMAANFSPCDQFFRLELSYVCLSE